MPVWDNSIMFYHVTVFSHSSRTQKAGLDGCFFLHQGPLSGKQNALTQRAKIFTIDCCAFLSLVGYV